MKAGRKSQEVQSTEGEGRPGEEGDKGAAMEEEAGDRCEGEEGKGSGEQRKRKGKAKQVEKEPHSAFSERPARERKSVHRFVVPAEREKARELKIEKGSGTLLKDIPNVVFKLSKRTGGDDVVQLLHKLFYGKRVKPFHAKTNILQFSGYVWGSNEEKEKARMTERLEKCNKDSLFQVAELLDLSYAKSEKKEEIVAKLMEFLESPYKTRDVLMEDSQNQRGRKGKKRKRESKKGTGKLASAKISPKIRKSEKIPSKIKRAEEEDGNEGAKSAGEEEEEEEKDKDVKKRKRGAIHDREIDVKVSKQKEKKPIKELKKKDDQKAAKGTVKVEKASSKASSKDKNVSGKVVKENVKEATSKESKSAKRTNMKDKSRGKQPGDEELRGAICDLLKEADFSTVTFSDVVTELEKKFKVDLTQQRGLVKVLIREEINKIAEEEDDDTDEAVEKDKEESDPGALSDEGVEN